MAGDCSRRFMLKDLEELVAEDLAVESWVVQEIQLIILTVLSLDYTQRYSIWWSPSLTGALQLEIQPLGVSK